MGHDDRAPEFLHKQREMVLAGAMSLGSQALQIDPGRVASEFGTSCL
jgi:hypothetical protein